jgi:RNA polymerase sigma factor (TIGR02999 family)
MSTTALVNEAWLRLRQSAPSEFADRRHFVAIAARAMRNVLVDYARERGAAKRGGGAAALDLDEHDVGDASETLVLEVADALDRLEAVRPRLADVVYLRYFGGLSDAEVGDVLGIEESTVRRDWQKARGWLYGALQP